MEVADGPEPRTDGPLRPGHRDTIDELLDPVLPDDPHADLLRSCGGRHREVARLLRLQTPGLTLREVSLVDHGSDFIKQLFDSSRPKTAILLNAPLPTETRPRNSQCRPHGS